MNNIVSLMKFNMTTPIFILGLYVAPAYAKTPFLDLPQAVKASCAIMRGHAVKLAASSFYNSKIGHDQPMDEVWSFNVAEVYDWDGVPLHYRQQIRQVIFVIPYGLDMRPSKTEYDVVLFLTCNCGDSIGTTFEIIGPWIKVYEYENDGVKNKFIRDWGALGVGQGKEIPLEDFKQMISKEVARQKKRKRK